MLRDRLVCVVNHKGIQRKLLAESSLTYDSAIKLALAVEASERESKQLAEATEPPDQESKTSTTQAQAQAAVTKAQSRVIGVEVHI